MPWEGTLPVLPLELPMGLAPAGDELGPCDLWIDPETLPCAVVDVDLTEYAAAATQLLYQWSGAQFGTCSRTARPCGNGGCLVSEAATRWHLGAWYAGDEALSCSCTPYRRIPLAGWPVVSVDEVKISGVVLDEDSYQLEEGRYLTRRDGQWPACQDLRLGEDAAGAFVVTYTYGQVPPAPAVLAARELACWLVGVYAPEDCKPPSSVQTITRQGVTYQVSDTVVAGRDLPGVALFLDAYNPNKLRRRGAVWSPDVERFAQ